MVVFQHKYHRQIKNSRQIQRLRKDAVIGSTIDFENIEAESAKKLDAIVSVLNRTFDKIRIANTGYVFLFDGKQELLVPPPGQSDELSKQPSETIPAQSSSPKTGTGSPS